MDRRRARAGRPRRRADRPRGASRGDAPRRVRAAIGRLTDVDTGTPIQRPAGVRAALESNRGNPANLEVLAAFDVVVEALRSPAAIAEVVGDIWVQMRATGESFTQTVTRMNMAASGGAAVETIPYRRAGDFLSDWAATGRRFFDWDVDTGHGHVSHMIQFLVVDRALAARPDIPLRDSSAFRTRMRQCTNGRGEPITNLVWNVTFDNETELHRGSPEGMTAALRPLFPDYE